MLKPCWLTELAAPPSCLVMITSGSKKSRWRWPKCQTQDFKTVVHKPMGDAMVATSTSFIQSVLPHKQTSESSDWWSHLHSSALHRSPPGLCAQPPPVQTVHLRLHYPTWRELCCEVRGQHRHQRPWNSNNDETSLMSGGNQQFFYLLLFYLQGQWTLIDISVNVPVLARRLIFNCCPLA